MADKKLSVGAKVFLIVLLCLLCGLSAAIFGCASAPKKIEKLTYECPSCGYKVDASLINKNIRIRNTCASCGKVFFYTTVVKYGSYGPSSVYQTDVDNQYFGVSWYSFEETPTGFSVFSGYFLDRKVKRFRVIRRWTTTRYHYP